MTILDELKLKTNGAADQANNIQEAISMMEFGGGTGGGFMVINDNNGTLDKTWQEIYDAMKQGKFCTIRVDSGNIISGISTNVISNIDSTQGDYTVSIGDGSYRYKASSATEYPKYDE